MRAQHIKQGVESDRMRICCLPVAGVENPYQRLMMEGLRRSERLEVEQGVDGKFFAALRTVIRHRPDVIHYDWIFRYFLRRRWLWTWLHAPVFVLEMYLVRYVLGCRIVWTLHNLTTHDVSPGWIELWTRRRFAALCDWIRVFSDSTVQRAADLMRVAPAKFVVVPEGPYTGYYPDHLTRTEARAHLGIDEDRLVLLYLGGIRPYKGLENLIRIFREVADESWTLLIAGRPLHTDYAESIRAASSDLPHVHLDFRFIPDEELQYYFHCCDVVVLPFSAIENSGSVILAMGFSNAVVAPAQGVLPDRLCAQPELLYSDDDLTGALTRLKDFSREELTRIGERNLAMVQKYRWDDFVRAFSVQEEDEEIEVDRVITI